MFNFQGLDIAISIILVFLFISLVCTAVREGLEAILRDRSMHIERGLRELLSDPDGSTITKALFDHPLLYGLFSGDYEPTHLRAGGWLWNRFSGLFMPLAARRNLPSYIPAGNFAAALLDVAARGGITTLVQKEVGRAPITAQAIRDSIEHLPNGRVQRAVLSALDMAGDDLEKAKKNLAAWFDSSMDRVSGWYKRRTQAILFAIGLLAAIALNIDAITMLKVLSTDKALRDAMVSQAQVVVADNSLAHAAGMDLSNEIKNLRHGLNTTGLPVGWDEVWPIQSKNLGCQSRQYWNCAAGLGEILLGWLITALAVTLGAPFWFDLLNKFMIVRSTVKPHEKSPEEASVDRQSDDDKTASAAGAASQTQTAATQPRMPAPSAGTSANEASSPPERLPYEANTWRDATMEEGIP